VTVDDLARYARRDWAAAASNKRDYWVEQFRLHGAGPARTASTTLLLHMRTVQPDYPSGAHRAEDLAGHRLLRQRLDRAAHAFPRR
jgi:hypothetical protein